MGTPIVGLKIHVDVDVDVGVGESSFNMTREGG